MSMRVRGRVDRCLDRVADRVVAGPGTFQRTVVGTRVGRRRRDDEHVGREPPVEGLARSGKRPALVPPAREEDQLQLVDHRSGHPAHDVVEPLVVVVVLDPRAAHVRDPAVDDDHLPVVEMQRVLEMEAEAAVTQRSAPHDEEAVMRDDLDPGGDEIAEQVLAAQVDLAADRVDLEQDLDALGDLRGQPFQEPRPDVAWLVPVDEQVHMVAGGVDVLEHPGEVPMAVQERLHRRRDRGGERHREVRPRTGRPSRRGSRRAPAPPRP